MLTDYVNMEQMKNASKFYFGGKNINETNIISINTVSGSFHVANKTSVTL